MSLLNTRRSVQLLRSVFLFQDVRCFSATPSIKGAVYSVGQALRETGAALDSLGLRSIDKPVFKEPYSRHRPVMNLFEKHPAIETDVFVAPSASVVGRVVIHAKASVMYGAVIRGDQAEVVIGRNTSIGDRAVLSTAHAVEGHVEPDLHVGSDVVIGAGSLLQSCTVEDGATIGAGSVLLEGSLVEKTAQLAPGSVLHSGRRVPAGQLWGGNPAVFIKELSKSELAANEGLAAAEAENAAAHQVEFADTLGEAARARV